MSEETLIRVRDVMRKNYAIVDGLITVQKPYALPNARKLKR
ncbi:hypothetical protein JCM19237_175 [Photobacterium aphoticum]|uniref:Uncharacterized protein n=1 Tax=Photobacterium aphoticum TaxID=754436 RepID=A0A090QYZ5_9GAMM|nr:hypothetical protein JCM19237_175 [Photobacterium aphoticum]